MRDSEKNISRRLFLAGVGGVAASAGVLAISPWWLPSRKLTGDSSHEAERPAYKPRTIEDTSGYVAVVSLMKPWRTGATLAEIRDAWRRVGYRNIEGLDRELAAEKNITDSKANLLLL